MKNDHVGGATWSPGNGRSPLLVRLGTAAFVTELSGRALHEDESSTPEGGGCQPEMEPVSSRKRSRYIRSATCGAQGVM